METQRKGTKGAAVEMGGGGGGGCSTFLPSISAFSMSMVPQMRSSVAPRGSSTSGVLAFVLEGFSPRLHCARKKGKDQVSEDNAGARGASAHTGGSLEPRGSTEAAAGPCWGVALEGFEDVRAHVGRVGRGGVEGVLRHHVDLREHLHEGPGS